MLAVGFASARIRFRRRRISAVNRSSRKPRLRNRDRANTLARDPADRDSLGAHYRRVYYRRARARIFMRRGARHSRSRDVTARQGDASLRVSSPCHARDLASRK